MGISQPSGQMWEVVKWEGCQRTDILGTVQGACEFEGPPCIQAVQEGDRAAGRSYDQAVCWKLQLTDVVLTTY